MKLIDKVRTIADPLWANFLGMQDWSGEKEEFETLLSLLGEAKEKKEQGEPVGKGIRFPNAFLAYVDQLYEKIDEQKEEHLVMQDHAHKAYGVEGNFSTVLERAQELKPFMETNFSITELTMPGKYFNNRFPLRFLAS